MTKIPCSPFPRAARGSLASLLLSALLPMAATAASLEVTLTTRPDAGVFPIGETVQVKFRVYSGSGQTLTASVTNEDGVTVWGPTNYLVSGSDWSTTVSMPSSLGFYRVWASLPGGATIPAKGTRPAGYITYAVVPEPLQRPLYDDTESFFGLQGGFNEDTDTDILALLGVRWNIRGKEWDRLEPSYPGQYTGAPRTVESAWATNGHGAGSWTAYLIPNLMRKPTSWDPFKPGTSGNANIGALKVANETDWVNFCRNVAKGYKHASSYGFMTQRIYELTWEPMKSWNFYLGTDADFARIYELGTAAIHDEDPGAIVVGPCNVLDRASWMNDTFDYLNAGMKDHIDGASMHPYVYGRRLPERWGLRHQLNQFKWKVKQITGSDLPMFGTEQGADTGNSAGTGNDYTKELEHALKIVRSNLIMLGEGWRTNVSYWVHDYLGTSGEYGMGLFYNLNTSINFGTDQIGPKTVIAPYSVMTWLLEGHHSTAVIDYLDNNMLGYACGRDGSTILALWKFIGSPSNYTIDTGVGSVDVYDWMGNKTTATTSNGELTLTLSERPTYVKGVSQSLWGIDRQDFNVARGKPVTTNGDHDATAYPASNAVDGNNSANSSRWISAVNTSGSHWIEVDLQDETEIDEIRFWTGEHVDASGNYHFNSSKALDKYKLQYWNGSSYQTIPGADVTSGGNTRAAVQHTFSPLTTSKVRLLMPTPWSSAQIRLYEIEVLSTNSVAGGNPAHREAEDLTSSDSGQGLTLITDASSSGGEWIRFDAVATGNWIEFTVPGVTAGTYTVKVLDKTHTSRGTYQLSSGGASIGSPVDQYGGGTYREITLGDVIFGSTGSKTFRFTVAGKHAGSSGYNLSIDAIVLIPQASAGGLSEAEDLGATNSGQGSTLVTDTSASGGEWIKFDAVATGNWIEFTVPSVASGIYTVKVLDKTHTSRGTYQLSSGGANIGSSVDQYGGGTYREVTLGNHTVSSTGNQTFRFTVTGKNGGSSGYNLSIDAIALEPQ